MGQGGIKMKDKLMTVLGIIVMIIFLLFALKSTLITPIKDFFDWWGIFFD